MPKKNIKVLTLPFMVKKLQIDDCNKKTNLNDWFFYYE